MHTILGRILMRMASFWCQSISGSWSASNWKFGSGSASKRCRYTTLALVISDGKKRKDTTKNTILFDKFIHAISPYSFTYCRENDDEPRFFWKTLYIQLNVHVFAYILWPSNKTHFVSVKYVQYFFYSGYY